MESDEETAPASPKCVSISVYEPVLTVLQSQRGVLGGPGRNVRSHCLPNLSLLTTCRRKEPEVDDTLKDCEGLLEPPKRRIYDGLPKLEYVICDACFMYLPYSLCLPKA